MAEHFAFNKRRWYRNTPWMGTPGHMECSLAKAYIAMGGGRKSENPHGHMQTSEQTVNKDQTTEPGTVRQHHYFPCVHASLPLLKYKQGRYNQ